MLYLLNILCPKNVEINFIKCFELQIIKYKAK